MSNVRLRLGLPGFSQRSSEAARAWPESTMPCARCTEADPAGSFTASPRFAMSDTGRGRWNSICSPKLNRNSGRLRNTSRWPDFQTGYYQRPPQVVCRRGLWYDQRFWASGNNSVVECDLAKVEVAGSNPVSRSIYWIVGGPCTPTSALRYARDPARSTSRAIAAGRWGRDC
jgi:hypothetical protein